MKKTTLTCVVFSVIGFIASIVNLFINGNSFALLLHTFIIPIIEKIEIKTFKVVLRIVFKNPNGHNNKELITDTANVRIIYIINKFIP